ncbi:MAG: diphosphomevalonate/mevalonate 3,5-bisphosphate decarboxylase family protein [Flavobacterium sp.]
MLTEHDFIPKASTVEVNEFDTQWSAPSNIAIVKYWGKKSGQIPANPSLSFTLNHCKTITSLSAHRNLEQEGVCFEFSFEGKEKPSFRPKIETFLKRIESYTPYLNTYHLKIDTSNTFPHSSGIASSASGMAALSVGIMSLERALHPNMTEEYFWNKASFLARLGSGSACRSLKGEVVIWGNHQETSNSTDLFGVSFENLHENFKQCQDTILLVDKGEKEVSSTLGHDLMLGHPFAHERFEQAHRNLTQLKTILTSGDWESFIALMESEALTLHAMMMTSQPYFILMKPNTLEIIQRIWKFRRETGLTIGFTLDAGANVHVLYPKGQAESVLQFIKNELIGYCQNQQYICDEMGSGAMKLT